MKEKNKTMYDNGVKSFLKVFISKKYITVMTITFIVSGLITYALMG